MILNVTEEQKKLLESQGYMVVEFKLWYRKFGKILIEYARRIIDKWKAIILFFQEKAMNVFENIKCQLKYIYEKYNLYLEQIDDANVFHDKHDKHEKYQFVRSLERKYQPNFSYKVIYHRCRDRC